MDLKHFFHALQLESPKRILELDVMIWFNFLKFLFIFIFFCLCYISNCGLSYFGQEKRTNYFEANSISFFFILLKNFA